MTEMNLFLLLVVSVCQPALSAERSAAENMRLFQSRTDPVSNFLSDLGNMFLDIDGAMAVQMGPKVEFQDNMMGGILRPLQPRKDYFDRIQGNYREIQKRVLSLVTNAISPRQVNDGLQVDLFRGILFPRKQSGANNQNARASASPFKNLQGSVLGTEERMRATIERILKESRHTGELINEGLSNIVRRSGSIANDQPSKTDSESRFEQYIRQLLRNHGRWIMDNPLLQTFRLSRQSSEHTATPSTAVPFSETVESITEATETKETTSAIQTTTSETSSTIDSSANKVSQRDQNYYVIDDSGNNIREVVEVVLKPDPDSMKRTLPLKINTDSTGKERIETETESTEQSKPRDTMILAFTPDGVPLKLRLGPEIENPIKYLHRILRAAGVTLQVPVESYDDTEPVGKEVLLLGSRSWVITRSVYLNLSNPNELRSLLRTLIKSNSPSQK